MEHAILIKYAEIHLKGLNRPFFEKKLVTNIRHALGEIPGEIVREQGRVFVYAIPEASIEEAALRLTRVFGIHSLCITRCVEKDWETIVENAGALMAPYAGGATFKVFARRADKRFPMTSIQLSQEIGGRLAEAHPGVEVDVHHPEYTVYVEVRDLSAYVHGPAEPGAGGLPTGVGGRAMVLLSGGIDSPVAAYMMAKRGVEVEAVHFFSYPYTSQLAKDKVIELARLVTKYSGRMTVNVVSFTEIQEAIRDNCPEEFFTLIMRRFMMEIAQRIAKGDGCGALITGENLGQVASQTMEAMTVTGAVVDIPIFMPLVGMDKKDIISIAREIGTLDTSILPYEDCCTVFTPKHPKTKPTLGQVVNAEKKLDREALIARALENVEKIKVTYHDEPLL
mgnify:CR=1 FL=1